MAFARAGQLRHPITIQRRDDSARDSYGQPVESWAALQERWASIEGLTGGEIQELRQTVGDASHRFRIRYLSGLTDRDRISWNSRIFNIVHISNPDQVNRDHVITTKEEQ